MKENHQTELLETLSALADGEANDFETRRILKEDDQADLLREQWSDYQRIGSLLRKEPHTGVDISAAISQAVAEEANSGGVKRFFKPFSQVAVAASVAGLALFGVNQYQLAQLDTAGSTEIAVEVETVEPVESVEFPQFNTPLGFDLSPQTELVSSNPEVTNISEQVRTEIPFDQRALYEHVSESIQQHSEDASEASQDVYPLLRVPVEE